MGEYITETCNTVADPDTILQSMEYSYIAVVRNPAFVPGDVLTQLGVGRTRPRLTRPIAGGSYFGGVYPKLPRFGAFGISNDMFASELHRHFGSSLRVVLKYLARPWRQNKQTQVFFLQHLLQGLRSLGFSAELFSLVGATRLPASAAWAVFRRCVEEFASFAHSFDVLLDRPLNL